MADKRPLTLNANGTKELLQPGNSLDIGGYTLPNTAGSTDDLLVMGAANAEWTPLSTVIDGNAYDKTGWDASVFSEVTLTFTNGTRTVAIAPMGASASYYIAGIKYTFTTEQSVVIDDTEGLWYIYFNGSTLTASQTLWTFDDTKCFVATLYWDATNNINIGWAPELHSWVMQDRLHHYLHNTFGTRYNYGLGVAEATTSTVDVAIGGLFDEDIQVDITDEVGSGWWDQVLSPLTAPIYYRTGAGLWRKLAASTSLCYLDTNIPQVNIFSGTWQWQAVTTNRYFAYWVVASGNSDYPVYIVPGQESADKLSDTLAGNLLADMDFAGLPTEEHKVIARLILRRIGSGAYYEITQIDDYRYAKDENAGAGTTVSDHGNLTGLADDDHAQYHNDARAATWIDAGFSTTGNITIDSDSNGLILGDGADYNIKWGGDNAVHDILVTAAFEFNGGAIRLPSVTTAERDALTPENGMSIYNSDDEQFQCYENGAWETRTRVIVTETNVYVKTTGNDTTGDGTDGNPWLSIDKALEVIGMWILLDFVNINIEKGAYSDTDTLEIRHSGGKFINILGDYETDTLTYSSKTGSSGNWDITFTTTNTSYFTVNDMVLIHTATGGTLPNTILGTYDVVSINPGVSVTLHTPSTIITMGSGAVSATVSIPQVKFVRRTSLLGSINQITGIQTHFNCTTTAEKIFDTTFVINSTIVLNHCIWYNTNATRFGRVAVTNANIFQFNYCGVRYLATGLFVYYSATANTDRCGATDCTTGFYAFSFSNVTSRRIHCVSCTLGLQANFMSFYFENGGGLYLLANGTDSSPARLVEGNSNSYMHYNIL